MDEKTNEEVLPPPSPETPPEPPQTLEPTPAPQEPPAPPQIEAGDRRSETSAENGQLGGRPKGSISETTKIKRMMRQLLVEQVYDQFGELMQAKFDLAKGHWEYVEHFNETSRKKETIRVYKTSPDAKSLEYLIDQVVGKPTSKIAFEEAENLDDIIVTEDEQKRIDEALGNIKAFQKEQEANVNASHEPLR